MYSLLAQQDINLGGAFKLQGGNTLAAGIFRSPRAFISAILPNTLVLAGLILLLLVVGVGISMIANASNPEAQQKSKGVATNAALGFMLVFAAYWIIQIIEVVTGVSILNN